MPGARPPDGIAGQEKCQLWIEGMPENKRGVIVHAGRDASYPCSR
jgi:hypothetical protein